jgi:hypothetical protein
MNQLQDFSAGSTGMEGFYVPTVVKVAVINHLFVPGAGRAQPTDSLSSKLGMFQTSYSVEKLVDTLSRARASGFEARTGPLALKSGHLGRRQAASVAWSGGLLVELYKPV